MSGKEGLYGCSGKKVGGYPDEGAAPMQSKPNYRKDSWSNPTYTYESDNAGDEQRVTKRGALRGY